MLHRKICLFFLVFNGGQCNEYTFFIYFIIHGLRRIKNQFWFHLSISFFMDAMLKVLLYYWSMLFCYFHLPVSFRFIGKRMQVFRYMPDNHIIIINDRPTIVGLHEKTFFRGLNKINCCRGACVVSVHEKGDVPPEIREETLECPSHTHKYKERDVLSKNIRKWTFQTVNLYCKIIKRRTCK